MSFVTHQPYSASMLLAGPAGGEVCKVLDIRVALDPPVLERERVKVDRAPVNNVHNGELGLSAKRAGTVALQLLFREINHNQPVQRLWIDIDPPSLQVTGRSAELLFGLVAYLRLGATSLPEGVPNSDFMATGLLDPDGNVGSVEAVAVKLRAALAAGPKVGTRLFYPRTDEAQIGDELRAECRSKGLILCPVDRIDEALDALGVPILGSWPQDISPFRALEAFDTRFSRVFFGRQREVEALTSLLEARAAGGRPGALVIGASGAGKSSFCLAGVLPALIKRKPGLQYAVWRPRDAASGLGDEPVDEQRLAQSILSQWQLRDERQLGMALAPGPKGAPSLDNLPAYLSVEPGQCSVFVVDQFEELFTLNFTPSARIGIARLLQSLQARGIWVIGTLRSEFYASYLELADKEGQVVLTPLFEGDGQYNLPRMSRDAFSQVIIRPAELAGLQFEQRADGVSLAQTLLADAMATEDALPLLGFALQKLYDEVEQSVAMDHPDTIFGRTLGFAGYEKLGGLAGAIGSVAAEAFSALDAQAQLELPSLLNALAVPSAEGTRETARPAPIDQWPLGKPGRCLIDALIRIRVLVSELGPTPDAPAFVRVAHEALFSHWGLAAQLLADSQQNRLLVEDFRQKAKQWDAEGQPRDRLLTSPRDIANASAIRYLVLSATGNEALIAFIDTSVRRAMRQRNTWYASAAVIALMLSGTTGWALVSADTAQRAAGAERAQKIAAVEAKALAVREQRKAARAQKRAEAAAASESQQRREALRQRDAALVATQVATEQRQIAQAQTLEAKRQRSRAIAQLAEQAIDRGDAMTGILLARSQLERSDETSWVGTVESALRRGLIENLERQVFAKHTDSVSFAQFSADGEYIVTASRDGTARLWSVNGGAQSSIALVQHTDRVNHAEFSPDGKQIVTASGDGTARLWTFEEGRVGSIVLEGHTGSIFQAHFSPDGQRIATASYDGTARLWSRSGDRYSSIVLEGHKGPVRAVQFSPDGRQIVTTSDDGTAKLWSLDGKHPTCITLEGHSGTVIYAEFSPDGRQIVTASNDKTARLWSLRGTQTQSVVLAGHTGWVNSARFSPDGKKIVTASRDGTARLWSTTDGQSTSIILNGHSAWVTYAEFSPDNKQILTASRDGTSRLWSMEGDRPRSVILSGHTSWVNYARFSPDGSQILTASRDGTARLWSARGGQQHFIALEKHRDKVNQAEFSPDGKQIVTASSDGTARLWTPEGARVNSVALEGHRGPVFQAHFSPDGQKIVTASGDGTARLWLKSGDQYGSIALEGHKGAVRSAQFSPDGQLIVTASDDGTARIWSVESNPRHVKILNGHTKEVINAHFSPDGKQIVTASRDGTAKIWKIEEINPTSITLYGHNDQVLDADFSPDGKKIVTSSRDGTARIWNISKSIDSPIVLTGHTSYVYSAIFSPNGRQIVTASFDGTARLWSLDGKGPRALVLEGHNGPVRQARFSPNGQEIVTASDDGSARLWSIRGGEASSVSLQGHADSVYQAQFSPNGRQIITASDDGSARLWANPTTLDLLAQSDHILTRCLTLQQVEQFGLELSVVGYGKPPCH